MPLTSVQTAHKTQAVSDAVHAMIATCETRITEQLNAQLARINMPDNLREAVRYSTLGGGKRARPALCVAAFNTCGGGVKYTRTLWLAVTAVELLHCYSLIHDDLPCMDDDDLRRGKPTCHVVYGEATALLAGDVLQALAFELLAQVHDAQLSHKLTQTLAMAARRMVVGQMRDLNAESPDAKNPHAENPNTENIDAESSQQDTPITQEALERIHKDKTGALIEAAVVMGGLCAEANQSDMQALRRFAQSLGLAFQVQDDILDITATTQTLGKPARSDDKLGKATYPRLMGLPAANAYAKELFSQAKQSLSGINKQSNKQQIKSTTFDGNELLALADWLWARQC